MICNIVHATSRFLSESPLSDVLFKQQILTVSHHYLYKDKNTTSIPDTCLNSSWYH